LGWHIINFGEMGHKLEEWVVKTLMVKELKKILEDYKYE